MANYREIASLNDISIRDEYLTNLLTGFMPRGLIADQIFLQVPTTIDTARLVNVTAPLTIESNLQISPTGFPTIQLKFTSTDSYQLKNRGVQAFLDSFDIQNLGGEARAKELTNRLIDTNIRIAREWAIASALTNTATIVQNFNVPTLWDDPTADILSDVSKAIGVVRDGIGAYTGCGLPANTVIMGWKVYNYIRRHPALVKAWLGTVGTGGYTPILNAQQLAVIFDVKRVLVAEGKYDAAESGQTRSLTDIWGKNVIFCYITDEINPNEAVQSLGYTFVPSTPDQGFAEFSYDWTTPGLLPQMGKYIVRGYKYDDKLTDASCACLLPNVIA